LSSRSTDIVCWDKRVVQITQWFSKKRVILEPKTCKIRSRSLSQKLKCPESDSVVLSSGSAVLLQTNLRNGCFFSDRMWQPLPATSRLVRLSGRTPPPCGSARLQLHSVDAWNVGCPVVARSIVQVQRPSV